MRRLGRALLVTVAALALVVVAGYVAVRRVVDDRSLPVRETTVLVPNGASGREIARLLEADRVISSAAAFDALARFRGVQSAMKAGEFDFAAHTSMEDVLREVTGAGKQVAVWVTIPEG